MTKEDKQILFNYITGMDIKLNTIFRFIIAIVKKPGVNYDDIIKEFDDLTKIHKENKTVKVMKCDGPVYLSKEDQIKVCEMIDNCIDNKERARNEKNGALDDFNGTDKLLPYSFRNLLINAQDIESAEARKEIVNMIWSTLLIYIKNTYE